MTLNKREAEAEVPQDTKKVKSSPVAEEKVKTTPPIAEAIIEAIRNLKSHGGSSIKAIIKQLKLKEEGGGLKEDLIKKCLKDGTANGTFIKNKASFLVAGDPIYADLSDKVTIKEIEEGKGDRIVKRGDTISIKYRGSLATNGEEFDKGDLTFQAFGGEVVKGFDHSVCGMKIGGKRICDIPSSLGYGKRGSPPEIPPNSDLVFEIELLSFK